MGEPLLLAKCVLVIPSPLAPKTSNPIPVHIQILLQAFSALPNAFALKLWFENEKCSRSSPIGSDQGLFGTAACGMRALTHGIKWRKINLPPARANLQSLK
jgi:hypothetical protein